MLCCTGWVDVTWDAGGSNSYRMGAEGKFDLALAPSHDQEKLRVAKAEGGAAVVSKHKSAASSSDRVKVGLPQLTVWS